MGVQTSEKKMAEKKYNNLRTRTVRNGLTVEGASSKTNWCE
jgi:hypothetical protein